MTKYIVIVALLCIILCLLLLWMNDDIYEDLYNWVKIKSLRWFVPTPVSFEWVLIFTRIKEQET
jgi:hypothetical protein